MQYDERELAQLAATIAAGFIRRHAGFHDLDDRVVTRAAAQQVARASLLVARHILVGAKRAAQKVDELELLYDDADFL
jgi:hypothetical protein